jgi:transcriptional regulator with XRE-family HTH domain
MTKMAKKLGKPTLTQAETDRVLDAMRRALRERHSGNQAALARSLKLSPASISNILSGGNKPSIDTARALGEDLREDYRQWLDPPTGIVTTQPVAPPTPPVPPATNGVRPFYTRNEWAHLMDPALEILIREQNSAADSRDALESSVSFNTAKGREPTLDDVLRLARAILKENARDSGTIKKKSKHT